MSNSFIPKNERIQLYEREKKKETRLSSIFYIFILLIIIYGVYSFYLDKYVVYFLNDEAIIDVGNTYQLELIPKYSKNFNYNNYIFTSDDEEIAKIDELGQITALKNGTTEIGLRFKNDYKTKKLKVVVDNIDVKDIDIDKNIIAYVNETKKINYKINSQENVNTNVKYKSSDESVLKVDKVGNITGLKEGKSTLTIESDNGTKEETVVTVITSDDKIEEIKIKNNSLDLYVGENKQLEIEVFPNKADTKGLKWSSSDKSIVTVNDKGVITAKKEGYAIITVKTKNNLEAKCAVNVNELVDIVLNKYNDTLIEGEKTKISANIDVTWKSSDEKIAVVDKDGNVTAKKEGKVKIIAKDLFGNTKECNITVEKKNIEIESILLDKTYLELNIDDVEKLSIEILPSNANNKNVVWTSDNNKIAIVDSNGRVTAKKKGSATISVKSENGKVATCLVKVTSEMSSINLDRESVTLEKNKKIKLNVIGTNSKNLTWKSSDEKVAKVDSNGNVSTLDYGNALITVTTSNGLETSCIIYVKEEKILVKSITINNPKENMYIGDSHNLKVTINPNNATNKSVSYSSSNTKIASIDESGKIIAKKEGTVTIYAKASNQKESSFKLVIKPISVKEIKLNKKEETITIGKTFNIISEVLPNNATNKILTYTSSDEKIAKVDSNGKVTGLKQGKTTITINSNNGITATLNVIVKDIFPESITLSSTSLKLIEGDSSNLTVTIKPANATNKKLIWNTSNSKVASINDGKVKAIKEGTAVISVYSETDKNIKAEVLVEVSKKVINVESISLDKTEIETFEGNKVLLSAIIIPSDATNKSVTWKSSDSSIATVSSKGEITAIKSGKVVITSVSNNGKEAKCNVTVKKSTIDVDSIKIDSNISVINIGEDVIISYTLSPSNATNKNVTWKSSDSSIATIDKNGKVKGIKEGSTKISVSSVSNPSVVDYKDIIIRKKEILVSKLKLNETNIALNMNETYKLNVTISPSDATNKNITWTSSNNSVATVNSNGEIKATKYGVTKITAKSENDKTASCNVIVLNKNIAESYNSETLKYWFEKPESNYGVTRIWVKDAYNQMKINAGIVMTNNVGPDFSWGEFQRINEINACYNDPNRDYVMYQNLRAHEHYADILNKNDAYNSKKGLVAFNASGVISTYWGTDSPCSWHATPPIPLFINEGKVLRDSTDGTYNITKEIRGLNKDGDLVYYKMNSGKTDAQKKKNKELAQKIIDSGIRYTFDFRPVLVENYVAKNNLSETNNIRQAICQIDKQNFVVITSTVGSTSEYNRTYLGLNYKRLAEIFVDYGCKIGFNLDGGGSTVIYFKNDSLGNPQRYGPYDGRMLTDMMYFIEK